MNLRGIAVNCKVYLPNNDEQIMQLSKQLATIAANTIMSKLNSLHITKEEKKKILIDLKDSI